MPFEGVGETGVIGLAVSLGSLAVSSSSVSIAVSFSGTDVGYPIFELCVMFRSVALGRRESPAEYLLMPVVESDIEL